MKGKKILAVLLMFVMIFAMTACGGGASGEDKVYNLKISLEPSESNFMAENWREWADAVTEASDQCSVSAAGVGSSRYRRRTSLCFRRIRHYRELEALDGRYTCRSADFSVI